MAKYISLTGLSRFLTKLKEWMPWKKGEGSGATKLGNICIASGQHSVAHGSSTTSSGHHSHAEGEGTTSSGTASHAEGHGTSATGYYSHAEGWGAIASVTGAHAEGEESRANGYCSHAEGGNTIAYADGSHSEGVSTKTTGYNSHAEGSITTADGDWSHSEGYRTLTSGYASHAEGEYTTAGKEAFYALYSDNNQFYFEDGRLPSTIAVNDVLSIIHGGSVYFDCSTVTSKNPFTVNSLPVTLTEDVRVCFFSTKKTLKNVTESTGNEDVWTNIGGYSHAEGRYTQTYNTYEHAEGIFNKSNIVNSSTTSSGNTLHSVGIGTSNLDRKNAFEITQNGDAYIKGVGTYDGTNPISGTNDVATIIGGKVSGPSSCTANRIATFSDATGKVIKDSGYTIATSVPSGAVFTDTKVTQSQTTANETYGVLLKNTTGNTDETNPVKYSSGLIFNPSTTRLGVGTTSPGYTLHVNGPSYSSAGTIAATYLQSLAGDVYVGNTSGSRCHQQYDSTNKCLKFIFD